MNRLLPLLSGTFLILSCIHEYPDLAEEEIGDVTPISVAIQVLLVSGFDTLRYITKSANDNSEKHPCRFLIEVYEQGERISHQSVLVNKTPLPGETFALPVYLHLHASVYTIAVWADYVDKTTHENTYYNTENMQNISLKFPYVGNTTEKECQCGYSTLDLRVYENQPNAKAEVKIHLTYPQAKYEFITTDVRHFLEKIAPQYDAEETFSMTFNHEFFIPSAFNMLKGQICDSWEHSEFTVPLHVNDIKGDEYCIGFDYLFAVPTESVASVSITFSNASGEIIASTPNVKIPYKQGYVTTIKGNFLTPIKAGIYIDMEYEDDINIKLDEIIYN